jgi:hypothetical protein
MQEWWAFELECELILKYKNHGLCNKTNGGEGASGVVVTEETKQKHLQLRETEKWRNNLSKKAKERFNNPEFKKAHIDRHFEVMNRPEVKEKLRAKALQQFSNPDAIEAARQKSIKQFSNPEARKHARKKALERFNTPEKRANHVQAKSVMCVETNEIFGTCTLASEWLKSTLGCGDNSQISKVCRGIIKTAYGYTWKYVTKPKAILAE